MNTQQHNENGLSKRLISSAPKKLDSYNDLVDILSNAIDLNNDNLNIGVIGSFGTGKSSFLKTFKENSKKHKIVTVSLANFQNQNKPVGENQPESSHYKEKIENEKYLESIIIQQILYSAKRCSLPGSRIKRIGLRARSVLLIIFAVFASLCVVLSSKLHFDIQFVWIKDLLFYLGLVSYVISFILFVLCFPLTSIVASFNGVQVKSEPNINSTLFDEYLDELIYFFYKTKTDIVIFEDIDRCSNDDIFNKLRTLNFTLNNSPYFKNRKIRFIYAVKEDLFISSETRSKFFDILISLPPLISKSNSFEHLSAVLRDNNIYNFDKHFLIAIASFIESYRQINNIVNDFMVFVMHKYNNKQLELSVAKRLFTILTFKSLFPYDYLLFVKGYGYLWHLVANGKNNYSTKAEFDNVYINPSNKIISERIASFYSSLNDFIDKSSISLVSFFVPLSYKSQEEKIFYESIEDDSDYYAPEYIYEHAKEIVLNENAAEHYASSLYLNISILKEILNLPTGNAFAESFFESFNLNTKQQLLFIKYVMSIFDKEVDMCFAFFDKIAAYYPSLLNLVKEEGLFANSTFSKRFFKECLNNKSSLIAQNNGSDLINIINNSDWADEIICNLNNECASYVLTLAIVAPRLDLEQFYKGDNSYKDNFLNLVRSGKFNRTVFNYKAFVKSLSYSQKIDTETPLLAQLFNIETDTNTTQIKTQFINVINNAENNEFVSEIDKFDLCNNETMVEIFKTIINDKVIDDVTDKCKIIYVLDTKTLPLLLLKKLVFKRKLNAPISVWNMICDNNEEIANLFISMIYTNYSLFLNKENNKNESYITLLLKIVNDERCDYSLAGKILELTCDKEMIQLNTLKNKESIRCAINYRYCAFDSNDIENIDDGLLVDYFNCFASDIANLDDANININTLKLEILLKVDSTDNKCLIINKYVSSIDKDKAKVLLDIISKIDDPFPHLSPTFVELLLCSKYMFSDNVTRILLNHYREIMNFNNIIEKVAKDKIRFSCFLLEIKDEFKSFIKTTTNGKYYIRHGNKGYFIIVPKR